MSKLEVLIETDNEQFALDLVKFLKNYPDGIGTTLHLLENGSCSLYQEIEATLKRLTKRKGWETLVLLDDLSDDPVSPEQERKINKFLEQELPEDFNL